MSDYYNQLIRGVNVVFALVLIFLIVITVSNSKDIISRTDYIIASFGLIAFATFLRFICIRFIKYFGDSQ